MPNPLLLIFLLAYIILHSLLASLPCKALARRLFGASSDRWYRLWFNFIAIITLLPLLPLLVWLPDQTLYIVPEPWRWLLLLGQGMAALGLLAAVRQTDAAHFLGLRQLHEPAPAAESPLTTRGFYAYVRHPIYSFGLLFMWLSPVMSVNLLTVYLFWTVYMYVGSIHEEHRLIHEFGDKYRAYQQQIPRLIPRLPLLSRKHKHELEQEER